MSRSNYIEFFYNPQRKHARNGMLSPIALEQQQKLKLQGIWETWGYSIDQAQAAHRECLKLCVSERAHAVFRYGQAPKRPANIMAS